MHIRMRQRLSLSQYTLSTLSKCKCLKSIVDPTTSILPPGRSSFLATVYMPIILECKLMDPAWFGWLVAAVPRVPHVRCGPHNAQLSTPPLHFALSNHGHGTTVVPRYGTYPAMT